MRENHPDRASDDQYIEDLTWAKPQYLINELANRKREQWQQNAPPPGRDNFQGGQSQEDYPELEANGQGQQQQGPSGN